MLDVKVKHDGVSLARLLPLPPRPSYLRQAEEAHSLGEDGLRRREGLRARHSTVHSGHIIMTFTRLLDRYSVIRV